MAQTQWRGKNRLNSETLIHRTVYDDPDWVAPAGFFFGAPIYTAGANIVTSRSTGGVGAVVCLDPATGADVWTRDLNAEPAAETGFNWAHGTTTAGGGLVIASMNTLSGRLWEGRTLYGLNVATGAVVWTGARQVVHGVERSNIVWDDTAIFYAAHTGDAKTLYRATIADGVETHNVALADGPFAIRPQLGKTDPGLAAEDALLVTVLDSTGATPVVRVEMRGMADLALIAATPDHEIAIKATTDAQFMFDSVKQKLYFWMTDTTATVGEGETYRLYTYDFDGTAFVASWVGNTWYPVTLGGGLWYVGVLPLVQVYQRTDIMPPRQMAIDWDLLHWQPSNIPNERRYVTQRADGAENLVMEVAQMFQTRDQWGSDVGGAIAQMAQHVIGGPGYLLVWDTSAALTSSDHRPTELYSLTFDYNYFSLPHWTDDYLYVNANTLIYRYRAARPAGARPKGGGGEVTP